MTTKTTDKSDALGSVGTPDDPTTTPRKPRAKVPSKAELIHQVQELRDKYEPTEGGGPWSPETVSALTIGLLMIAETLTSAPFQSTDTELKTTLDVAGAKCLNLYVPDAGKYAPAVELLAACAFITMSAYARRESRRKVVVAPVQSDAGSVVNPSDVTE